MSVEILALPTLQELRVLLYQGDEEAVILRLIDKCNSDVLTIIRDRIVAEKEGQEPRTALSNLIASQDMVDSITLAIGLKKLAEERRGVGKRVMPDPWKGEP